MILCCGEALIDMLPRLTEDGAPAFEPVCGGAVFNTAIALARLGAPSALFTGLSEDVFGQQLMAALEADGVDHALALRSARPTTLAFVTLQDGQARYAFYDENTAGRMLRPADLPALPAGLEALFVGGISLATEPCAEAYERLALSAPAGTPVMLDPNIRPDFIADTERYRARLDRLVARADIVKMSDEDLAWYLGSGELDVVARDLIARGPKLVCITEGARGARAVTAELAVLVPAPSVIPVDTVGAGDTFNAGLLAALREAGALTPAGLAALGRPTLTLALEMAVRAAAVTVSRAGANPPHRDEIV